ncbi:PilZ domain-containing protein [Mesorhizobium sp. BR1-1-2]|uniref:PilZ domain-containing protein n=1 Tax=Mesorhizobium sp. BR1-1-2 TaxID=2876652 RepID=UPI001CCF4F00|nr:PilZ domain-containing protein [Mesorhizobium sp. BR1-1-2]MBZ9963025.1 PilZ domain-containing protein [Mesorhizobium sp. BR1-1-2]
MTNPANPIPERSDEHKREHRQRVLKGATIITGISNSEVGCTLRNQNDSGAELKIPPEARIPDRFLLYVPVDGIGYRCEVRWRRNGRIGVQFTGTEPKPRTHYG